MAVAVRVNLTIEHNGGLLKSEWGRRLSYFVVIEKENEAERNLRENLVAWFPSGQKKIRFPVPPNT